MAMWGAFSGMGASDGTEFLLGLSFCGAVLGVVTGGAFVLLLQQPEPKI